MCSAAHLELGDGLTNVCVVLQGRAARPTMALVRVWRPTEDLQGAQEGDLLSAYRLTAYKGGSGGRYAVIRDELHILIPGRYAACLRVSRISKQQ